MSVAYLAPCIFVVLIIDLFLAWLGVLLIVLCLEARGSFLLVFWCPVFRPGIVRFEMVFVRLEKPIRADPRLSEVFPMLPLKQFQCLIDDGPLPSFQGRWSSASCFFATPLQAIDGVMSW